VQRLHGVTWRHVQKTARCKAGEEVTMGKENEVRNQSGTDHRGGLDFRPRCRLWNGS
jgi:hypothetical protein